MLKFLSFNYTNILLTAKMKIDYSPFVRTLYQLQAQLAEASIFLRFSNYSFFFFETLYESFSSFPTEYISQTMRNRLQIMKLRVPLEADSQFNSEARQIRRFPLYIYNHVSSVSERGPGFPATNHARRPSSLAKRT